MSEVANKQLMVSVYKEFKYNLGERNLIDVLQEIKSDKYQSEVNSIRYALHKGDEKTADEIKSGLNGFTMSGTFGTSRTKANLVHLFSNNRIRLRPHSSYRTLYIW
jgi:hypothetical protein